MNRRTLFKALGAVLAAKLLRVTSRSQPSEPLRVLSQSEIDYWSSTYRIYINGIEMRLGDGLVVAPVHFVDASAPRWAPQRSLLDDTLDFPYNR